MNWLKFTVLVAFAFCTLALTSCEKKTIEPEVPEPCEAPDVPQNIIGSWNIGTGTSAVEFRSNGDLVDLDDKLIGMEGGALKSYTATNDSLYLKAESLTNNSTARVRLPIVENECDKITIEFIGVSVPFNRDN